MSVLLTLAAVVISASGGEYRDGLKQGVWVHLDEGPYGRLRLVERYEAGWLIEELDLNAVREDLQVLEPFCMVRTPGDPTWYRARFHGALNRWAQQAQPGGLLEEVVFRGGDHAADVL